MVEITSLLATNNYLIVNRDLMRMLGINEAILLGELASEFMYWRHRGEARDGWFFSTMENLEARIPLCDKTIRKTVNNLVDAGLIETKRAGLPAKKYYRFNEEKLRQLFEESFDGKQVAEKNSEQAAEKNSELLRIQKKDYIQENMSSEQSGFQTDEQDDSLDIPLASTTTHHVEVTVYDSDDDNNCITIKHQVAPREWNKAVRKWRKDISEKVLLTFMDTNETERVSFKRIKKYNVRPRKSDDLGYDRSAGTQFGV